MEFKDFYKLYFILLEPLNDMLPNKIKDSKGLGTIGWVLDK